MTRDLPATLVTEVTKRRLRPFFLLDMDFDSAPIYLWSGGGQVTFDGKTYLGAGDVGSISPYKETNKIVAQGLSFILSGIKTSLIAAALLERYQGRKCRLYFGAFAEGDALLMESGGGYILLENGSQILVENPFDADPYQLFGGFMDIMEIRDEGATATITVSAENSLIKLMQSNERRYTPEDQKIFYPDDEGLDFVPQIQDREVTWGKTKS